MQPPHLLALVVLLTPLLSGCVNAPPEILVNVEPNELQDMVTVQVTLVVDEPYTYWTSTEPGALVAGVLQGDVLVAILYNYDERKSADEEQDSGETVTADDPVEVTVMPGTYSQTFHWNGNDGIHTDQGHSGDRVPPGEYTIVAELSGYPTVKATTIVQALPL